MKRNLLKEHPNGFFVDMNEYPNKLVPLDQNTPVVLADMHRHDRGMTIRRRQIFIDSKGKVWQICPEDTFDGASIPRFFWRIWNPYQSVLRDAAAFHDVYCRIQLERQADVHRMFREIQRHCGSFFIAWVSWFLVRAWCRIVRWNWK